MRVIDPMLAEYDQEMKTTRRLLEHVPEEKLAWQPHERAKSLGELALHVARLPAIMTGILGEETFDFAAATEPDDAPASLSAVLGEFDASATKGRAFLDGLDDARATANWRLVKEGQELMSLPRVVALRSFLLNHLYHHRGQMTTYLRIAGAHVPSVYGPTADENPFG